MQVIRSIHRWLGFMLAVFIVIIAASGLVLIFKEPLLRFSYPILSKPITSVQQSHYPITLTRIEGHFQKPFVKFMRFPREGMNVFQLWLSDETRVFVDPSTAEVISVSHWSQTVFELHAHLLSGSVGKTIVGCIGLSVVFFLVSGVLLWWMRRNRFKIKDAIPNSKKLIQSHYTLGVIFTPFILLSVGTGTVMIFHQSVEKIVTAVVDSHPPLKPHMTVAKTQQPYKPWVEILKVINETLPEGELQSWSSPKTNNSVFVFRKRMPEEWHPYGRTFILLDPYEAKVIQRVDARKQQVGMRMMETIYPLHAVKVGGGTYKYFSVLSAISLFAISVLGLVSFIRRPRIFRKV